jgi:hypothetical protein
MSVKPNGSSWTVAEQVFLDKVTGLTFQFEVMPDGEVRLRVFGDALPFGNREYFFNEKGVKVGSGMMTSGFCRPAWLSPIDG